MKIKFGKKSSRLKLPVSTTSKEKIKLEIRTEKSESEKAANQIFGDTTLHIKIPVQLIKPDKLFVAARDELSSKNRPRKSHRQGKSNGLIFNRLHSSFKLRIRKFTIKIEWSSAIGND